jgi:thiosulfate reductase cytochrome b subunit
VLALNGFIYLAASTRGRAWRTWKHYYFPQRAVYAGVLAMGSIMVLTGFALWFKHQAPWLLAGLGGERVVLPAHIVLATGLLAFIAIHVASRARRLARIARDVHRNSG